jgi:multiple sugar transport system permease protein
MSVAPLRRRGADYAVFGLVGIALLFFGFPTLWMIVMALKSGADIGASPLQPFIPVIDNFRRIVTDQPLLPMIANSAVVSIGSTVLSVFIGSAAAYGILRLGRTSRAVMLIWFLFQRAVPPVVMFVPLYVLFSKFGLLNSHIGLVLAYTTFELPFVVMIMLSFFEEVPAEIGEAAQLDGASAWYRFWSIDLPLVAPGLASTTFFCLLFSWNEFILAKIIAGPDTSTLPLAVNTYLYAFGSGGTVPWGPLAAVGVVIIIPVFVVALLMQKYLVRGMTLGAVK